MSTAPQCGNYSLAVPSSFPFVTWSAIKGLLSATSLGAYIAASETAAAAKDVDPDEIGTQAVSRVRQRKISDWDDVKQIWQRTSGSLAERAAQIEREIRNGDWEVKIDSQGVVESQR